MKLAEHLAMLSALLLVCTCAYTVTAQPGGCNTLSTFKGLINGTDKIGIIPYIRADHPGGTVFIFGNL